VAGWNHEPFPKQVLIGYGPAGNPPVSYESPILDSTHWDSITYWIELYGSIGAHMTPASVYVRTGETLHGPWVDVVPGGETPAIGAIIAGTVSSSAGIGRYVKFVADVQPGQQVVLALRVVVRAQE